MQETRGDLIVKVVGLDLVRTFFPQHEKLWLETNTGLIASNVNRQHIDSIAKKDAFKPSGVDNLKIPPDQRTDVAEGADFTPFQTELDSLDSEQVVTQSNTATRAPSQISFYQEFDDDPLATEEVVYQSCTAHRVPVEISCHGDFDKTQPLANEPPQEQVVPVNTTTCVQTTGQLGSTSAFSYSRGVIDFDFENNLERYELDEAIDDICATNFSQRTKELKVFSYGLIDLDERNELEKKIPKNIEALPPEIITSVISRNYELDFLPDKPDNNNRIKLSPDDQNYYRDLYYKATERQNDLILFHQLCKWSEEDVVQFMRKMDDTKISQEDKLWADSLVKQLRQHEHACYLELIDINSEMTQWKSLCSEIRKKSIPLEEALVKQNYVTDAVGLAKKVPAFLLRKHAEYKFKHYSREQFIDILRNKYKKDMKSVIAKQNLDKDIQRLTEAAKKYEDLAHTYKDEAERLQDAVDYCQRFPYAFKNAWMTHFIDPKASKGQVSCQNASRANSKSSSAENPTLLAALAGVLISTANELSVVHNAQRHEEYEKNCARATREVHEASKYVTPSEGGQVNDISLPGLLGAAMLGSDKTADKEVVEKRNSDTSYVPKGSAIFTSNLSTIPETRSRSPTPERSPSPVRRTETRSLPAPNWPTRPREETNDSIQMPYGKVLKEDSAAERFFNNTSKEDDTSYVTKPSTESVE